MSKDLKLIGRNLKQVRLAKGLTQVEIAHLSKISPNHYARIERGESAASVLVLCNIIKNLKTTSSKILPF